MKLSRDHIPLYFQLQQILRKSILSGKISPEDPLPTENELCNQYGVSRTTVRQAFTALLNEGLISRIPGKGTFIIERDPTRKVVHYFHTTGGLVESSNFAKHKKKIHYRGLVTPSIKISKLLNLEQDKKIFCLRGTRYQGDQPICFFITSISSEHAHYFRGRRLTNEIMLTVLERELGQSIQKVRQTFRAVKADERVARHLAIKKNEPVLELEQIYFVSHEIPIEVGINYFHADQYQYAMELKHKLDI
ncbi:MAG: GntR family transcriptional regulator [Deltaproteobacteria bacterium]|nr:GntR family transcriptional regulator [Deltaproteobacteria bacterium]